MITDRELFNLISQMQVPPQEEKIWRQLATELKGEDREEFATVLRQMVQEEEILATRQANELVELMAKWRMRKQQAKSQ